MSDFLDRLNAKTYEFDEPVSIQLEPSLDNSPGWKANIAESIFDRISLLAAAYKLHLLPAIDKYGPTRLNQIQTITLCDELDFVNTITTDVLVRQYIQGFLTVARRCAAGPHDVQLIIEGP